MDGQISKDATAAMLVAAALEGTLSDAQAEQLAALDPTLQKLAWLAAAQRIAEQDTRIAEQDTRICEQDTCIAELTGKLDASLQVDPATPSGQRPIYTKPPAPKRRRKPGAKTGHQPSRRPRPKRVERHEEHRLDVCPDCGGDLQRCKRKRTRTVEDILEDLRAVVTEHTVHRDYCPACKKHVEPVVPDALPTAIIGHRLVGLTAWLHYGLGVTIDQVRELLRYQLQTHLSAGGLVAIWQWVARILELWYEQIAREARDSAVLHADETGWRVDGRTYWLWCFANPDLCYYLIDRSRGSPALEKFFIEAFDGILVTDFWAAYNAVTTGERQLCLVHLLRELEKVDLSNDSVEWQAFAKKLRRLVRDGIRLRKRPDFEPEQYTSRIERIDQRLMALARAAYTDKDASRLAKRLLKYCDSLFTFLDHPAVPFENNFAERMIRPAVVLTTR